MNRIDRNALGLAIIAMLGLGCLFYAGFLITYKPRHVQNLEVTVKNIPAAPQVQPTATPSASAPQSAQTQAEVLELTDSNSITFRGEVTSEKVTETQMKLMKKSRELPNDAIIYMVLDTPGGSIDAGNQLIDTVHAIPQKVKTLTVFAASMGFQFVQNMDERLIVPSGTLMSHRAKIGGLGGEVPGELIVRLDAFLRVLTRMDSIDAARMGLKLAEYRELVRDEYWVSGVDAVTDHAADRVVLAKCDESLDGTTKEYIGSIFGVKVYGIMSKCPVVNGILGIEVEGGQPAERQKALEYGNTYSTNKRQFTETYILTRFTRNQ